MSTASTKVMVRDKVSARLGGNLLTNEGNQAHVLSLRLGARVPPLRDDDLVEMAKSFVVEVRRRHCEVQALRNTSNVTLELSVFLDENEVGDRGAAAFAAALCRVSDIARLRVVNLFRNRLGDAGASAVADLLRDANNDILEVRLGANPIGRDARAKLEAVARDRGTFVQLPRTTAASRFFSRAAVLSQRGVYQSVLSARFVALDPPMNDADAIDLARRIKAELRERSKSMPTTGSLIELKIWLQQNRISDEGMAALSAALASARDVAWVSDLRVYANRIGDVGARAIAGLMRGMVKPPSEIHLSDNFVGSDGAKALLDAAAASTKFASDATPLWLQLGNNDQISAEEMVAYARDRLKMHVCLAEDNGKACTKTKCAAAARNEKPAVHLLCGQRGGRRRRRLAPQNFIEDKNGARSSLLLQQSPGASSGGVKCCCSVRQQGVGLSDDDAVQVAVAITDEVRAKTKSGQLLLQPLDLEIILDDNRIGDRGLVAIAGALLHVGDLARVTSLSLARNAVVDATPLADLISKTPWPVASVSIAHNHVRSCVKLIEAAKGRYPTPDGGPFVLDASNNLIPPDSIEKTISLAKVLGVSLDDQGKGNTCCAIRLPQFTKQRSGPPTRDEEPVRARPHPPSIDEANESASSRAAVRPKQPERPTVQEAPPQVDSAEDARSIIEVATKTSRHQLVAPADPAANASSSETSSPQPASKKKLSPTRDAPLRQQLGAPTKKADPAAANASSSSESFPQPAPKKELSRTRDAKKKPIKMSATTQLKESKRASVAGAAKLFEEAMLELGFSEKHAQWIAGAFLRCKKSVASDAAEWVIFGRDDSFNYSIPRALSPQQQRKLQDRMLLQGCVAILTATRSGKKGNTKVSVIACTERLSSQSLFEDVEIILSGCLGGNDVVAPSMKTNVTENGDDHQSASNDDVADVNASEKRDANVPNSDDQQTSSDAAGSVATDDGRNGQPATNEKKAAAKIAAAKKKKKARLLKRRKAVKLAEKKTAPDDDDRGDEEEEPTREERKLAYAAEPVIVDETRTAPSTGSISEANQVSSVSNCDDALGGDDDAQREAVIQDEQLQKKEAALVHDDSPQETGVRRHRQKAALAAAEAATAAWVAQDALDDAAIATLSKKSSIVGHKLRMNLQKLEHSVWLYIEESIGEEEDVDAIDRVSSVLDAFVPAFEDVAEASRDACVRAIITGAQRIESAASLQSILALVRSIVLAVVDVDDAPSGPEGRWALLASRALAASEHGSKDSAVVFASVLLHWRARTLAQEALAITILKSATLVDFGPGELRRAYHDFDADLIAVCRWLAAGVTSDVRDRPRPRQADGSPIKSKAEDVRDDAERERREERRQRRLLLERFARRPSTAGWKASINAKNVVYGGVENAKIRYLDGKIVTTTGQKEVVIRDGPAEGEGYNRFKKTSAGTLRCAAAGSKTIG
ncbi:hypothetical protein CTAYLR_002558 [Chrysophaeum taylorii]|uniref:Uncharacterized protein n=1 Tax=Chrysophaeum taylorii TaxID=2483200 RepID=A0AAD7XLD0_9STRA|nr:hypothetical protein CTAYLR_002558 [Chrysophaeum taylorii]